ncbi:MAG: endonuclease domain-containing protein [Clostridia bacterium]|nr:endonuclease domain-containing protein [Clostridia bacterium]
MKSLKNANLTEYSKKLRKEMTKEERHLWYDFLKTLPVTVHRQKVLGPYIADFFCAEAKLVIELDGSQHYSDDGIHADQERDAFFKEAGITVVRYTNLDINRNFNGVCGDIWERVMNKK